MNLIFMGTPEFAVPSLRRLIAAGHTVRAVFTQPDRPVGRKQMITAPPVKLFAERAGLTIFQPEKIKTPEARERFEPLLKEADAGVVAAYGRILPVWMLDAPRHGFLNVHSSLLPKYRGAAPINWAIARGERETGVTIMQMDAGLDTGAILLQRATPIGAQETTPQLTARLAEIGAELLLEALAKLERGALTATPQDETEASYAPLLKREDGEVDWTLTAPEISNRQRGFTPFPGCYTFVNGQRLEIIRAEAEASAETPDAAARFPPGTVCAIAKDSFTVACGQATRLRIDEVQPAGKRAMPARDFLNGAKLQVGARCESKAAEA
jgi:methionyl-tRNA formyltransferase